MTRKVHEQVKAFLEDTFYFEFKHSLEYSKVT